MRTEKTKKTQPKTTEIAFILDRSGSMQPHTEAAIAGFNEFLRDQQQVEGKASALLCTLVANCREQKIDPERYFEEALRRMPLNATVEEAAELTPAKLASLIRELQPRPAYREKRSKVAAQKAAA